MSLGISLVLDQVGQSKLHLLTCTALISVSGRWTVVLIESLIITNAVARGIRCGIRDIQPLPPSVSQVSRATACEKFSGRVPVHIATPS